MSLLVMRKGRKRWQRLLQCLRIRASQKNIFESWQYGCCYSI